MNRYPSIALIEFADVASGIVAGDAMVKRAPISMLKTGTISRGKYLILIGGSVASVEEAFTEGVRAAEGAVIDCVILPRVDPQVHDAILGTRKKVSRDALGIVDTKTVSAIIRCSDAAVKGAEIDIVELRLGDNLGGKAFALYNGILEDVEAAVTIVNDSESNRNTLTKVTVIPRLDEQMAKQINDTTAFKHSDAQPLDGGEI